MDTIEVRPSEWSFIQKVAFRLFSIFFIVCIMLNPNGGVQLPFFEKIHKLYIPVFQGLATWVSIHIFNLPQPLNTEGYGSGDTTLQYLFVLIAWAMAIIGCLVWSIVDVKRRNYNKALYWVSVCLRYYLGTTMISYGFAKFFKTQFTDPSYYRLTQSYGNSSPMGLAWTFFGYSMWYNYFMGFAEVLGGLLLFFRRTATLGALITLAVSANIMAVNYSFDVPVKILSTLLVAMSLFLLAKDAKRLFNFFILNKLTPAANISAYIFKPRWRNITLTVVKYLIILNVLGGTIESGIQMRKIINNMTSEENLYGTYEVTSPNTATDLKPDTTTWQKLVVRFDSIIITFGKNSTNTYAFNLDRDKKQLGIFTSKNNPEPAYILNYNLAPKKPTLLGTISNGKIKIQAVKTGRDTFPLMVRGFHWINEFPNNK